MLRLFDRLASKHLASGRFDGAAHDARISHSQSPRDAEEWATRADAGRPAVGTAADGVEQLSGSDGRMPERSAHDCAACTHVTARHLNHWRARLKAPRHALPR